MRHAKFFGGFQDLFESYSALKLSNFKVKNASQKWPQTSPKSILALHTMKKWTENSNMTFFYLPRSIDTNFLVVYEPYRALEGLQGVGFQGKNCLTKWSQTSPKSILALHTMKKWTKNSNMTFWYLPRSIDTFFWFFPEFWQTLTKVYNSFRQLHLLISSQFQLQFLESNSFKLSFL